MTDDPKKDEHSEPADNDATTDVETAATDAAESTADEHSDSSETAAHGGKVSPAPVLLAITALLLAILGLVGVAWQSLATSDPDELVTRNGAALERLSEQLRDSNERLERSEQALAALRSSVAGSEDDVGTLRRTLNDRLGELEAVPGRLSNIESSMSALQGISSGLRDTWLLSEAEYYLQIGNAQLRLAGNVSLARTALRLADERLVSLGNPALTGVRRALADELRQLDALGEADTEGAALTLSSLAGAIESLPLKTDIAQARSSDLTIDQDLSGMARAWASVKNSLSNVISVRRSDQPVKPLLPPDAAYFLRSNLALQLQAARLALLRGEQTLFTQSLDDAASWIGEYYDARSLPVKGALETIKELRATEFRPNPPDISGSLALLRQFISLQSRNRPPAPAAAEDDGSDQ